MNDAPIGIFDSGFGGLTVARSVRPSPRVIAAPATLVPSSRMVPSIEPVERRKVTSMPVARPLSSSSTARVTGE